MPTSDLKTAFVISPFGEPNDTYFALILKPALEECGLYAVRGDSLYRPTTIIDDIWQGIKDSTVLVAELTGRNPNVFYELGLAHAISKPVVLLAQNIEDVPFDLRAIRVLVYDKDHPDWGRRLQADLTRALKEVLQSPTTAIPVTFKVPSHAKPVEEAETLLRIELLESQVQRLAASVDYPNASDIGELASPLKKASAAERPIPVLEVGQKVVHIYFGVGSVLSVEGTGRNSRAQVNFERAGVKWLALSVAKIQVVASGATEA